MNRTPEETEELGQAGGAAQERLVAVGRVGGRLVGILIDGLRGVDRVQSPTPLPGAPGCIAGLVCFRHGIEVAVDLGVMLGGQPIEFSGDVRAVLAEADGLRGAILLDRLLDVSSLNLGDIQRCAGGGEGALPVMGEFQWRSERCQVMSSADILRFAGRAAA